MRPDPRRRLLALPETADDDASGWLITFSDLTLQLFAFVLVALVTTTARQRLATPAPSPPAPPAAAREVVDAPPPARPAPAAALAPPRAPEPEKPVTETPGAAEAPRPEPPAAAARLAALAGEIEEVLTAHGTRDAVTVTTTDAAVVLSLADTITFDSGKADLLPGARAILDELRPTLQALPDFTVEVIGHTDDVPIHTPLFPSNLELSLARAARVAGALAATDPALRIRTRAAGFGEFRPAVSNGDEDGRARNRRVEVRLLPAAG